MAVIDELDRLFGAGWQSWQANQPAELNSMKEIKVDSDKTNAAWDRRLVAISRWVSLADQVPGNGKLKKKG